MVSTHSRGRGGEEAARLHLEARGYKIVESNYRFAGNEVDIIARDGEILCFVEVKSWQRFDEEALALALGKTKQNRIVRAARGYLRQNPACEGMRVRFDVVLVNASDGSIELYDGAFDATDGGI